jgi:D-alanine-D-alanine ligase-like ATP-grasp enzyme
MGEELLGTVQMSAGRVVAPALSRERMRGVELLAARAANALEVDGLVEIEAIVSELGNEFIVEVDTQPSWREDGAVASLCDKLELELGDLAEMLLHRARRGNRLRRAISADRRSSELQVETH